MSRSFPLICPRRLTGGRALTGTAVHRKLHAATGAKSDPVAAAHARHRAPDLDRRTMVINQARAHAHVWLDHAPGALARTKGLASLTALLDNAQLGAHIHQALPR